MSFNQFLMELCLLRDDGNTWITREWEALSAITEIERFMQLFARHKGSLFTCKESGGRMHIKASRLGSRLRSCLMLDKGAIREMFKYHRLSPYCQLFLEATEGWPEPQLQDATDVERLNELVESLRSSATSAAITKRQKNHERAVNKNASSVRRYLEALFRRCSRLLVIRLDLYYPKTHEPLDASTLHGMRARFIRHISSKLPMKGFIWTIEFGERRKSHCHLLLLLDGNDVWADESIAKMLGEYWKEEITYGLGGYWNCNADKASYERRGINALGMVAYGDSEKRKHLDSAAMYLVKVDGLVRLCVPGLSRTFGRGVMPRQPTVHSGRPRKVTSGRANSSCTLEPAESQGDLRVATLR